VKVGDLVKYFGPSRIDLWKDDVCCIEEVSHVGIFRVRVLTTGKIRMVSEGDLRCLQT